MLNSGSSTRLLIGGAHRAAGDKKEGFTDRFPILQYERNDRGDVNEVSAAPRYLNLVAISARRKAASIQGWRDS